MDKSSSEVGAGRAIVIEDAQNRLYQEDGKMRKLPVPSSDPNDPLNFGTWRHRLIMVAVCLFGVTSFGVVQSTPLFFGKLIPHYMEQTRGAFDPHRIEELASYPSLCMGLGNFLFVPLSMSIGRRPAFIFSNALLVASLIWAARSQSFSSHLGARCLQGLTSGVSDCLLPIIVLDISFLHQRSSRLVTYWTLTSVGASLLLIPVPFAVDHANGDWRISYYYWAAFATLSLICVTCLVPETLFPRPASHLSGRFHATDAYGTFRTFDTAEEAQKAGFEMAPENNDTTAGQAVVSYKRQFAPFRVQKDPMARFVLAYRDMFLCLLVPGNFWALAFNSMVFGAMVSLSLTYSQRLEMDPWHFSPSAVGTVQAGAAIGAFCALIIGVVAEPVSRLFSRRNGGTREPEHILPNFILPSLMIFLGLSTYGVVASNPQEYSWVGVHASFALFYFGFCGVSALTGVWLGELLPQMSGPAIILTCGGRNAVSFGYSSSFTSWTRELGFWQTYVTFGGVLFALACLSIPLFFVNKRIRKYTATIPWLHAY